MPPETLIATDAVDHVVTATLNYVRPAAPADATPRRCIEIRTIAFFAN